jgi:hypothetical protein
VQPPGGAAATAAQCSAVHHGAALCIMVQCCAERRGGTCPASWGSSGIAEVQPDGWAVAAVQPTVGQLSCQMQVLLPFARGAVGCRGAAL